MGRAHIPGHTPRLISPELYAQAQSVLRGHNRPKYGKHDIAFRGLLTCAHDDCTVTGELKKNKYVYYRCTGHGAHVPFPVSGRQEIAEKLGYVLRDVRIPPDVAQRIESSIASEHRECEKRIAQ